MVYFDYEAIGLGTEEWHITQDCLVIGGTMIVHQAYRFALDPSPRTERALASHVGAHVSVRRLWSRSDPRPSTVVGRDENSARTLAALVAAVAGSVGDDKRPWRGCKTCRVAGNPR
jgi:hypothetical protein